MIHLEKSSVYLAIWKDLNKEKRKEQRSKISNISPGCPQDTPSIWSGLVWPLLKGLINLKHSNLKIGRMDAMGLDP